MSPTGTAACGIGANLLLGGGDYNQHFGELAKDLEAPWGAYESPFCEVFDGVVGDG